ncbi:MAG: hypothetical protein ABDI20_08120 [Candidatus Bipolaricaulaceae bacterium]
MCDQMEGRTLCALADAAAWPVDNRPALPRGI